MKKLTYKCFLFFAGVFVSTTTIAQSESNFSKPFKDLNKMKETDRNFEQELKKKELQKAPSLLYIDKTDRIIKKDKKRRNKN